MISSIELDTPNPINIIWKSKEMKKHL